MKDALKKDGGLHGTLGQISTSGDRNAMKDALNKDGGLHGTLGQISTCGDRNAMIEALKKDADKAAKAIGEHPTKKGITLGQTSVKSGLSQRMAGSPRPISTNLAQAMTKNDEIVIEDLRGASLA